MKQSRYTDSQILSILKQNEAGAAVPELCCDNKTFYKWRSKLGGMDASLMKRMKELEDKNRRLKRWLPKKSSRLKLLRRPSKKYPIRRGRLSGKAISPT